MFKLYTFAIAIIVALQSQAQISINNNHMPQAGDTLRYSIAALDTTVLLNYQNSGANQTWYFDSLQAIRQGLSRYYNSSQTPYSSQVSNRIAEKILDTLSIGGIELYDIYEFYKLDNNEFAKEYRAASFPTGLSFPLPPTLSIAPAYTDKDEIYQFPLNYLDKDSSTYNFSYINSLVGAYIGSSGYRINEVDAWGTLITPYDTFNCIRVITDLVAYDTISFGTNSFGINSHTREYKWLTTQFGIPALTVSGNVIGGTFVPSTVQYRDTVRNVPSIFSPIALFNADTTVVEIGDSINLNNNTISISPYQSSWTISPQTYRWINGTNANSQSPMVQFTDTGYYDVQLTVVNQEGSDTLLLSNYIQVVSTSTSLKERKGQTRAIQLYPNPVRSGEKLFFEPLLGSNIMRIYSLDGKEVAHFQISSNQQSIQLVELKTGLYFVHYISEDVIYRQKLIVE